jgi:hypothetical protein
MLVLNLLSKPFLVDINVVKLHMVNNQLLVKQANGSGVVNIYFKVFLWVKLNVRENSLPLI